MMMGCGFGICFTLITCHQIARVRKWDKIVAMFAILSMLFYTISLIIMRIAIGQPSRECFVSYDIGLTFMSMDLVSLFYVGFLAYQCSKEVIVEKNRLVETG
jgi:hypothetical protein